MPTIDVENAWELDATAFGNHEFDYGPTRILAAEARRTSPSCRRTSSTTATGRLPRLRKPSTVFRVNGARVGVIGATVHNTPELVAAGNTAGLSFLDEADADQAGVDRLRQRGVRMQIVVIHEGADGRRQRDRRPAAPRRGTARSTGSSTRSRTRRSIS